MADYQALPQNEGDDFGEPRNPLLRKRNIAIGAAVAILLAAGAYILGARNELSHSKVHFEDAGISPENFALGLAKCKAIQKEGRHEYPAAETRTANPRFVAGTPPTLFQNATIFDGVSESFVGDVLVDNGLIVQVGHDIVDLPENTNVYNLQGRIITPGIVDMHSHVGVDSWPKLDGTDDANEMTQPLTPFVRSIDGFNPSDKAREWIISGGVTSSLVFPGSGNIMGGESYAFKLRSVDTLSTEEMLVEAGEENRWRYMKMACGENPKRTYGEKGVMPSTRLGEGWLFREAFSKATQIKAAQDDWCEAAQKLPRFGRHRINTAFPEDAKYDALVGILRDDVRLNIHCYETHDIETMVRHSNEFKFKIRAFHHGLDAYRIPDIVKRAYKNLPTVATFAGKYGYKKEAFQSSVDAPRLLAEAGIPVAMKSDHPVLNSQHLVYEAAQAHHYGLSEVLSIASVTSVPAKAIGLDHRIGKIAVGMDADIVIWEKHPLALGSHPLEVFIDGIAQIKANASAWTEPQPATFTNYPDLVTPEEENACTENADVGFFTGIKKILLDDVEEFSTAGDLSIIVEGGEVICVGRCHRMMSAMRMRMDDPPVYDLGGEGVVLPSLISAGSPNLGLIEIDAEDSTGSGKQNLNHQIVNAVDGLKFGGLHNDEAYKAGILTAVTPPASDHVVQGVSVAFLTGAKDALSTPNAVIKEKVALHVKIGHEAKSKTFPTVSSQIAYLRSQLEKGLRDDSPSSEDEFALVAHGKIPLVIEVHNRDEIIRIAQIKSELEQKGASIKITLTGATEAWTVANHLAQADIGVILRPYLCTPVRWTAQQCLPGAPLSEKTGLAVLYEAGVKVGLAAEEPEEVRQLSWIAGWAKSDLGISEKQAVGLVSWRLSELFGLPANPYGLVIYNGDPFEFGAKVNAIVGGGKPGIMCSPRAF
ncbi:hypothetical protein B0O80DRAFT_381283 [Mortierella sp. GBAus27b]|nr:hypothetical protein BGX31_003714 [Mortierella sp. GBA43]KAI8360426.1 hypothetical protein B0O80DRAFT_381283 [Mortierella sp. GBAus27b]